MKVLCCCYLIVSAVIAMSAILIFTFLSVTISKSTEREKCPYCYGKTFCENVGDITADKSFLGRFINLFNAKNVFYGDYRNIDIVVKKLATNGELKTLDEDLCRENSLDNDCDITSLYKTDDHNYTDKVWVNLNDRRMLKPFKICSDEASADLFEDIVALKPKDVLMDDYMKNVWTVLRINAEPLVLELLKAEEGWPFPKFYGSCGRLIVEEHRGTPLFEHVNLNWKDRAYLALQLVQAAKNLTFNHPKYRFYLTDVSPDNIAIDDKLKLTFIDLENLIVQHKEFKGNDELHRSSVIHDSDGFAFSEDDICKSATSDHNYYAICKSLLSKDAPYPMPKNGLLHDPPLDVVVKYGRLFELIEECATSDESSRVETAEEIVSLLNTILQNEVKNVVVGDENS